MFHKISDFVKDTTLFQTPRALNDMALIHQAWNSQQLISFGIKKCIKVSKIQDNILYLVAQNGTYAQEVQLQKTKLIQVINKILKSQTNYMLKDIVIFAGG